MEKSSVGLRVKVQQFGSFLSRMVMPNITAFIAWGFITALFIEKGWLPNEEFATLVDPMLTYLLPVLIAYTGGNIVYGVRGGVVGAIGVIGVIGGASVPMLLGGMLVGPLGAWLTKKMDQALEGKVKSGFEMLVNNFSAGILGMLIALVSYSVIGPVISGATNILAAGVDILVKVHMLPLVHILVEPAKVLFLNNAINHGVFAPIAMEQAAETGRSILFLIESNPGPGLGILLAYMFFGKGSEKSSAVGASLIHFVGGIHEIYFPYVLMNPLLLIAAILGGMSGTLVFTILGAGLSATASPGSIIAYMLMTPRGGHLAVLAGVAVATIVSFVVASAILRFSEGTGKNLEDSQAELLNQKAAGNVDKDSSKIVAGDLHAVQKIIFACDAGMGSSAMGASILKKKVKAAGLDIDVTNLAIGNLPPDADLVVTHNDLTDRAKDKVPGAIHISVDNFMTTPKYDQLVEDLVKVKNTSTIVEEESKTIERNNATQETESGILKKSNILINQSFANKEEVIRKVADIMIAEGYVTEEYYHGMMQREKEAPTSFGIGLSIPHGTAETKKAILKSGIVIFVVPNGVEWNEETVKLVIGIAGVGNGHLEILANVASKIDNPEKVEAIVKESNVEQIYQLLTSSEE